MKSDRLSVRICLLGFAVATTSSCYAPQIQGEQNNAGILSRKSLQAAQVIRWKLPGELREISALALDEAGKLFALTDEYATLYQLDFTKGKVSRRIFPGLISADYEGLAIAGGKFYLITSAGELSIVTREVDGGITTRTLDTGLGRLCEIEGLTYQASHQALLIACKKPLAESLKGSVTLFRWSLVEEHLAPQNTLQLAGELFSQALGNRKFYPSAVAIDPRSGHILVLASRQKPALAELSASGKLLRVFRLPGKKQHPQPEGMVMTPAGELILADEGGKKRALLAVYNLGTTETENR